jgi:DNA-binding PadR family transcriptional regulator
MSRPRIPDITHLQFLVLGMLRGGDRPGRLLRRALARHGVERTGPAFYQMMARLEDAGLVAGEYEQKVVDGQIIKERCYAITRRGDTAWSSTRAFYHEAIGAYGPGLAKTTARKPRKARIAHA